MTNGLIKIEHNGPGKWSGDAPDDVAQLFCRLRHLTLDASQASYTYTADGEAWIQGSFHELTAPFWVRVTAGSALATTLRHALEANRGWGQPSVSLVDVAPCLTCWVQSDLPCAARAALAGETV